MHVKEMRLLAHDIFFKNEYLGSSKIATVQKVFVCVYIYFFFPSTYTACMYAYGPEWMIPPEEMPHSSSTNISRRYWLGSLQSLCIGSWHIMVLLAQVQSHRPWPGSRRASFPFPSLAGSSSSSTGFSLLAHFPFSPPKNVLLDNAVTYRRVHFYKNIFGP